MDVEQCTYFVWLAPTSNLWIEIKKSVCCGHYHTHTHTNSDDQEKKMCDYEPMAACILCTMANMTQLMHMSAKAVYAISNFHSAFYIRTVVYVFFVVVGGIYLVSIEVFFVLPTWSFFIICMRFDTLRIKSWPDFNDVKSMKRRTNKFNEFFKWNGIDCYWSIENEF